MPQTISVNNDAFANYLKVALLPRNDRLIAFRKLSNEQKASFVKVQLAMQLVKRPELTKQQRNFISESISKVSSDLYDKENPQKVALANEISQETENEAFGLFAQKDAFEILEGIGASKLEDIALLQKYEDLLKLGMQQRKRVVNAMPITERVAVWKTQLAYHLATSSLNKGQKEFIVEFMPKIQLIFEASTNLSKEERIRDGETLEANIFEIFTKAEAYAVFVTIGIQNNVLELSRFVGESNFGYGSRNSLFPRSVKFDLSAMSSRTLCACRWYCDMQDHSCGGTACAPTQDGCGPLGYTPCTNLCYWNPNPPPH